MGRKERKKKIQLHLWDSNSTEAVGSAHKPPRSL